MLTGRSVGCVAVGSGLCEQATGTARTYLATKGHALCQELSGEGGDTVVAHGPKATHRFPSCRSVATLRS
ncbi:MAG TPA: hypothetical protein VFD88_06550 [Clostridia bacterium]|nr:hypothetical protein [Clostridia bacterium]